LIERGILGAAGEALIQRKNGVAVIPGGLQGGQEGRSCGQVDCHQSGHGR
jgi:hypothetical protein